MNSNLNNTKDKMIGSLKESVGEVTNSNELELKGKLQSMKVDIGSKVVDMKEEVMGKANHFIDRMKEGNRSK